MLCGRDGASGRWVEWADAINGKFARKDEHVGGGRHCFLLSRRCFPAAAWERGNAAVWRLVLAAICLLHKTEKTPERKKERMKADG